MSPKYADGISAVPVSITGEPLPNSRLISLVVFGEMDVPDPDYTLINMQWGQIMTHDMRYNNLTKAQIAFPMIFKFVS